MTSPEPLVKIQNNFVENIPHDAFYQNWSEALAQLNNMATRAKIEISLNRQANTSSYVPGLRWAIQGPRTLLFLVCWFFSSQIFQNKKCDWNTWQQFESRTGLTFCRIWSGSKLFVRVNSRQQKKPLFNLHLSSLHTGDHSANNL